MHVLYNLCPFFGAKFAGLPYLPENGWKGVASDYGQVKTTSLKIIGIGKAQQHF